MGGVYIEIRKYGRVVHILKAVRLAVREDDQERKRVAAASPSPLLPNPIISFLPFQAPHIPSNLRDPSHASPRLPPRPSSPAPTQAPALLPLDAVV